MALWGEGDPRWIVEERPDATNVNNWHWSEKNAIGWSKDKLKSLLEGSSLKKPGLGLVKLKEVVSTGEATANNRKGKLIFFYEIVIKLKWEADFEDPDLEAVNGTIEIPNLSEENEAHEINVDVTVTSKKGGDKVKDFLRHEGTKMIQDKMGEYIAALKKEYATDLILPTSKAPQAETKATKTVISTPRATPVVSMGNMSLNGPTEFKDLKLSQSFKCRVEELYCVFTVPEMVAAFTRDEPKINVKVGGAFSLFGGNITGYFDVLEPNEKIVQRWRFSNWPEGHYSIVTLCFTQESDTAKITLKQTNIPARDYDKTRTGWHNYYWESIKRTFGFGASLM